MQSRKQIELKKIKTEFANTEQNEQIGPLRINKAKGKEVSFSENDPEIFRRQLVETFGSENMEFVQMLLNQVVGSLNAQGEPILHEINQFLTTIHGLSPKDVLESMLSAQMVAVHNTALSLLKKASIDGTSYQVKIDFLDRAAKLLKIFPTQMEAFNRHRGKVQKVIVERVNVHRGGQAIVGQVNQLGGGKGDQEQK